MVSGRFAPVDSDGIAMANVVMAGWRNTRNAIPQEVVDLVAYGRPSARHNCHPSNRKPFWPKLHKIREVNRNAILRTDWVHYRLMMTTTTTTTMMMMIYGTEINIHAGLYTYTERLLLQLLDWSPTLVQTIYAGILALYIKNNVWLLRSANWYIYETS